MALDLTLFGYLSPIFVFILVFVLLYATLLKTKFLSEKVGLNGLVAFSMAFLFIIFPFLKEVLMQAVPWIIIIFLCIAIILMVQMFMGYTQESITTWMASNSFGLVITIIVVIVFLGALVKVFSTPDAQAAMGGLNHVVKVILNPKILGAVLILLVAAKVMQAVGFEK